jgi:hypothetical protein
LENGKMVFDKMLGGKMVVGKMVRGKFLEGTLDKMLVHKNDKIID